MPADRIAIGRFSSLTHLSQKALRLYDARDILVPMVKDRFTGYRYYSVSQIETALEIKTLSDLGFGLSEISEIQFALDEGNEEMIRTLFARRLRETIAEIDRLEKSEIEVTVLQSYGERFHPFALAALLLLALEMALRYVALRSLP